MYLRIDRLDLAQNQLKAMKSLDEDNALTTLAQAWVNIYQVSSPFFNCSFVIRHCVCVFFLLLSLYITILRADLRPKRQLTLMMS